MVTKLDKYSKIRLPRKDWNRVVSFRARLGLGLTTSLTSQDFDQSKFSYQKPSSNAREAHAKTCKNMALARPIEKSVRFSQASD